MLSVPPLEILLSVETGEIALQLGLVVLAVLISVWLVSLLRARLEASDASLAMSRRDALRLFSPPLAFVMITALIPLTQHWFEPHWLRLAHPLLLSLASVQFAFYVLRRIFKPSALLSSLEHIVAWLVWGIVALHITSQLEALIAALDAVGFAVGKQRISLYTAFLGLVTLALTIVAALWLSRALESRFIDPAPLQINLKVLLAKTIRTLLVIIAVLIALPVVGIDLTMLSVFGGAMGVGIGLGLQKVVANYFSGFTLLLDQSIRIGDMVTVNDRYGEVEDIRARYTVIRGRDQTETVIPNEAMVTSVVINHTLADRESRLQMPVQVAYDTDLETAKAVMLAAGNTHPRVIRPEDTHVRLVRFGESGIDLELVCWIEDPENGQGRLKSDINWAIWDAFQREGIKIPYPQRVVHLKPSNET